MVLGSGATVLVDIAPDGRTTVRWQSYFRDRKFEASPFDDFLSGEANGISLRVRGKISQTEDHFFVDRWKVEVNSLCYVQSRM